jgi:hypothetical protein
VKNRNRIGPGLFFCIPTLGRPVSLDWALALKALNPPINFNTVFQILLNHEVSEARNIMAKEAIKQGAEYLFFLGDDVIVPAHTLRQLIFRMEQDPSIGVVGGVYCAKCDPPFPLVFCENGKGAYWDWKVGEFFEVSGLGMDCTLIRTGVFKDITEPWFKTVDDDKFLDGINNAEQWTEDLYFFNKLNETDWMTYCDATVICDHQDIYSGRKYTIPAGSLPLRQKITSTDKKCLVIGPRIELKDESYDVVNFHNDSQDYRGHPSSLPFDSDQFDWVIVTSPTTFISDNYTQEWKRVLKKGCKLNINVHPWLDMNKVAEAFGGKQDGSFLEIIK